MTRTSFDTILIACCSNFILYYRSSKFFNKKLLIIACLLLQLMAYSRQDTLTRKIKVVYGVASFYSKHLEGTTTATGEAFHHSDLIAASNNFKLNSWVRITNLRNGKSVIVRINDRMGRAMQALGRVADVTIQAARQLGFINRGLARVKVEEVRSDTVK